MDSARSPGARDWTVAAPNAAEPLDRRSAPSPQGRPDGLGSEAPDDQTDQQDGDELPSAPPSASYFLMRSTLAFEWDDGSKV